MPSGKSSISIPMHKEKRLVAFYIKSNKKTKLADARINSYSIDMATTQSKTSLAVSSLTKDPQPMFTASQGAIPNP